MTPTGYMLSVSYALDMPTLLRQLLFLLIPHMIISLYIVNPSAIYPQQ